MPVGNAPSRRMPSLGKKEALVGLGEYIWMSDSRGLSSGTFFIFILFTCSLSLEKAPHLYIVLGLKPFLCKTRNTDSKWVRVQDLFK